MTSVSVVIPTRDRPELVRRAINSVLGQQGDIALEVIVVFDGTDIDPFTDLEVPGNAKLITMQNERKSGLAGARNTGIMAATGEYVAFLDDDDEWAKTKLLRQLECWANNPDATLVSCSNVLLSQGKRHERIVPTQLQYADFQADRIAPIHTSTLLWRRQDLVQGPIGLVDEQLPYAYGEDYDMILRAATYGKVVSAPELLVTVHWDRPSFFTGKWQAVAAGLPYLLDKHAGLTHNRRNYSHICGQVAFAQAALKDHSQARHWALKSLVRNPFQLRALAALAISLRLVPVEKLVAYVNSRGRGL